MDVEKLKAFHKVALTGSFTKAAGQLFLTQPAVSQKIQALENALGVSLFDRSGKAVHLTREGEILLSYTDRLFALYEEIESLFCDMTELNKGKISLGSTAVMGIYFMTRIIGLYNRKYPGIEIDLKMGNSLQVVNRLLEGEVEFGFTGWTISHPSLKRVFVHRERLFIVSSPANPLAHKKTACIEELRSEPFIWRERGTQTRVLVKEWFESKVGIDYPKRSIELENIEAVKRAVIENCGITIAPEAAVRNEIDAGLVKRVYFDDFDLSVDYHLSFQKNKIFSKASMAFFKLISESGMLNHAKNLSEQIKIDRSG